MKCKIQLMCFKSILSKIVCDSLNLSHKMLKLLRSGNDGALLQACKEDQKISSIPALSWRILPGSEIVEWCPVPLLDSHDQEMLIYNSIFVQMNLKLLPNHIIRS